MVSIVPDRFLKLMTPIQLDPNHQFNSLADTSPEQAQANTKYGLQQEISAFNASRAADYEVQFQSYSKAMDARPDATNVKAPIPAFAEEVRTNETTGWPYIATGRALVTPLKTWTAPKKTAVSWFTAELAEPFPGVGLGEYVTLPSGRRFVRIA